jgi:hypothetical protein
MLDDRSQRAFPMLMLKLSRTHRDLAASALATQTNIAALNNDIAQLELRSTTRLGTLIGVGRHGSCGDNQDLRAPECCHMPQGA